MTRLNRRTVLKGAAATAFLAASGGAATFVVEDLFASWPISLAALHADHFRPQVGSGFSVKHAAGTTAFTLKSVSDLPPADRRGEAFSLIFAGPSSGRLTQGTYVIRHGQLGNLELFITPINIPRAGVQEYEIVVNRL